jgi:hypothetical protein
MLCFVLAQSITLNTMSVAMIEPGACQDNGLASNLKVAEQQAVCAECAKKRGIVMGLTERNGGFKNVHL